MTEFSDADLMQRTVEMINKRDPRAIRVSSEHYLWLAKQIKDLERRNGELIRSLPGMLDA